MKKSNNIVLEFLVYNIPLILALILELTFFVLNGGLLSTLHLRDSIIFSIIISYIVFYIIFCITNKLSRATIISSVFIFVILLINQLKILYTNEPFMISDFGFVSEAGNFIKMILPNIGMVKEIILPFIVLILVLIGIVILTKKYDFKMKCIKFRIICFIVLCIILVVIVFPPNFIKNKIFVVVFNIDDYKDYESYTTNLQYYRMYGLISGMYGISKNNEIDTPQNYNENVLNEELSSLENVTKVDNETVKPNIIVLFSESFFDVSKIDEIKFNKEVTYYYNKFKQEGKSIQLLSPTFGGMSENVVFEFLTGGKICYFNRGYIPFTQLYQLSGSENMPSILKDLKNNGYYSKILFGRDHYNSEAALKKVGFDEYEDMSDTISMKNFRDELLINKLIEEFANKESDSPIFYMIETYENHMPYSIGKYSEYDINVTNSSLSEYDTNTLLAYSQAVYNIDNELKRIYEYIQNYDEPTMILFFGDHLPYLYTENGDSLFSKLSYFNTQNETKNLYRLYNTEALVLTNFDFDNNIPSFMSVELILPYIMNKLNIDISSYYDWLIDNSQTLTAYNSYLKVDNEGNKYKFDEKNEELDNIISLKQHMQYMLFMKQVN